MENGVQVFDRCGWDTDNEEGKESIQLWCTDTDSQFGCFSKMYIIIYVVSTIHSEGSAIALFALNENTSLIIQSMTGWALHF